MYSQCWITFILLRNISCITTALKHLQIVIVLQTKNVQRILRQRDPLAYSIFVKVYLVANLSNTFKCNINSKSNINLKRYHELQCHWHHGFDQLDYLGRRETRYINKTNQGTKLKIEFNVINIYGFHGMWMKICIFQIWNFAFVTKCRYICHDLWQPMNI